MNITIDHTPLNVPNANHPAFSAFSACCRYVAFFILTRCLARSLMNSVSLPFQLEGSARAIANTSIGQITLDPIQFNVTSGLSGLQGLKQLIGIDAVDVVGGSSEAIHLNIPGEFISLRSFGRTLTKTNVFS